MYRRNEDTDDAPSESGEEDNERSQSKSTIDTETDSNAEATSRAKRRGGVYTYDVDTAAKRNQVVTRTDRDNKTRKPSPKMVKTTPNAIWADIDDNMKQVKVEKTAVHEFVANYLFPKLKFVRGSAVMMNYSTDKKSICALVMYGCHQQHSPEGMLWWAIAKKQTVNEIKRLRNDASKNLKSAFLGTWIMQEEKLT
jgi:hypothetical protein